MAGEETLLADELQTLQGALLTAMGRDISEFSFEISDDDGGSVKVTNLATGVSRTYRRPGKDPVR